MKSKEFAAIMAFLLDHRETEAMIANNENSSACDIQDSEAALKQIEALIDSAQVRFLETQQHKWGR
jgi:hypothetical protein